MGRFFGYRTRYLPRNIHVEFLKDLCAENAGMSVPQFTQNILCCIGFVPASGGRTDSKPFREQSLKVTVAQGPQLLVHAVA
jgi:hypothetical protein